MRKPPGLFRRLASFALLCWVLGFLWFALFLPRQASDQRTDGIVVLTGGSGRIPHAIETLRDGSAARLLVAGVDREVRPNEFAVEYAVEPRLMSCCVTLGYDSVDTRSNALEASRWIAATHVKSIRLVTSDWHMRRAAFDLALSAPPGVTIVRDAVTTRPSLRILFLEYNKLLARLIAWLVGF